MDKGQVKQEAGDSKITSVFHIDGCQFNSIEELMAQITANGPVPADVLYIDLTGAIAGVTPTHAESMKFDGTIEPETAKLLPVSIRIGGNVRPYMNTNGLHEIVAKLTSALEHAGKTVELADGPINMRPVIRHDSPNVYEA